MKTVLPDDYTTISVRWQSYHMAIKKFLEGVAGLPGIPKEKNVKIVYATPSTAYVKQIIPMLNGLTERPIITFYQSSENFVEDGGGGTYFKTFELYNKKEDGGLEKVSFNHPVIKELEYTCDMFTTKMSDADYLLTLLECNCNKYKPYSCKVNGRPAQFYLDDITNETPIAAESGEKKLVHVSFKMRTPWAVIMPVEIETDVAVIEKINTYLYGEVDEIQSNE